MHPLQSYLQDLHHIRSTGAGVEEMAYYPALAALLNEAGKNVKPKVLCIMQLKNVGAGLPDGGFFTPEQFQKGAAEPLPGQKPSRGAIEVKRTGEALANIAASDQVAKYVAAYGQVLVTNLTALPARAQKRSRGWSSPIRWV